MKPLALKELDRQSSRFVIQQGIIGQICRAPPGVVLCMGPYNFPLYEIFTTLILALVVVIPSCPSRLVLGYWSSCRCLFPQLANRDKLHGNEYESTVPEAAPSEA
jgi:hypothetical protein